VRQRQCANDGFRIPISDHRTTGIGRQLTDGTLSIRVTQRQEPSAISRGRLSTRSGLSDCLGIDNSKLVKRPVEMSFRSTGVGRAASRRQVVRYFSAELTVVAARLRWRGRRR
jgi:hypothetical protein